MGSDNLTSWKPGQSGNPAGKKKGTKNIATRLREAMNVVLTLENPITGQMQTKEAGEFIYEQLIAKAAKDGDLSAIDKLFDRIEGKPIARNETKEVSQWSEFVENVEKEEGGQ